MPNYLCVLIKTYKMKQEQLKNQNSTLQSANGAKAVGEEIKKADLRLIKKKYRPAFHAKKAEMELGVINNFGNVLSQEIVTVTELINAAAVEENIVISPEVIGNIVPKKNGKGLDLRYLKKEARKKYKQVEGEAQAELDRKINEKLANLQTISNEELLEILTMANINPLGDKIVANDEEAHSKKDEEFKVFLKGSSLEFKGE